MHMIVHVQSCQVITFLRGRSPSFAYFQVGEIVFKKTLKNKNVSYCSMFLKVAIPTHSCSLYLFCKFIRNVCLWTWDLTVNLAC